MKRILLVLMLAASIANSETLVSRGGWVSVYAVSWNWSTPAMKNALIDDSCWTHVILMAYAAPNSDGTLNLNSDGVGLSMMADVAPALQSAGIKALFAMCCTYAPPLDGGVNQAAFIHNICEVINTYSLDGMDIDWEPIDQTNGFSKYKSFVTDLRDSLDTRFGTSPRKLITCYANPSSSGAFTGGIAAKLDQINIQGYDVVCTVCGYICFSPDSSMTWHQGPMYSGGTNCPGGAPMYNLTRDAQVFADSIGARSKIGFSARTDASVWLGGTMTGGNGVTGPNQGWTAAPTNWGDMPQYAWASLVGRNTNGDTRNHDEAAIATWLSFDTTGTSSDYFISFDDGWACGRKTKAVVDSSWGGIYVWRLDGEDEAFPNQQPDSLRYYSQVYNGSPAATTSKRLLRRK